MPELARRVSFADDIHDNTALSSWIQRSLKGNRAEDIAEYLRIQPERFFNSLVIALYGGTPKWVAIKLPPPSKDGPELGAAAEVLGVLHLGGEEKLFAVDGQHRLAGMKRFLDEQSKVPLLNFEWVTGGLPGAAGRFGGAAPGRGVKGVRTRGEANP